MVATLTSTCITEAATVAPPKDDARPELPGYRLLRELGRGGMGTVYLARRLDCGTRCAVKVMRTELETDAVNLSRFAREIDALKQLRHANIVRFVDAGRTVDGSPFLAMEHVAGRNLADVVTQQGPFAPDRVATIVRALCSALHEAHRCGIVHNDVKPANIMTSPADEDDAALRNASKTTSAVSCENPSPNLSPGRGEGPKEEVVFEPFLKLIDFGLSEAVGDDAIMRHSGGAPFAGSPLYASPESYEGVTDRRSDVYSVGATAYFLLTGRPVFEVGDPVAAYVSHATKQPVPLRKVHGAVGESLDAVIMKCLRKDPRDRFQSADELADALNSAGSLSNEEIELSRGVWY